MVQTGYLLRRKEDGWAATAPDFIDMEMDAVGFGKTEADAVEDLLRHPRFQDWLRQTGNAPPSIGDFDVDDGSDDDDIIPEREGRHGNFPPFQDPGKR
jgi:hypothetical protein